MSLSEHAVRTGLEGVTPMVLDNSESIKSEQEYDDNACLSERSPYADAEIITLHVGPDATRFEVHGTILGQSEVLAAKFDSLSFVKQQILVPELDESTAHTLVHYLYTSKYQVLRVPTQTGQSTLHNYRLGTCVYCAAVQYKLPGLAELAKEKIATFGEDVSISNILGIARDDAFPVLPDSEKWYPEYLQDVITRTMAEDPEPFRRPDFITQVEGNSRLLQVVWKTVMSNFATVPTTPRISKEDNAAPVAETAPASISPDHQKIEETAQAVADVSEVPPSISETPEVHAVDADATKSSYAESATTLNTAHEDAYKLDDIEPTVEAPQTLEPFTDEIGFEKSKMYQLGRKDTSLEVSDQTLAIVEAERPTHKRSDSVMQPEAEKVDIADAKAEGEGGDVVDDLAPVVVNGSNEANVVTKKNKKKKTKKSSIMF
ncbi:hypothetical protein FB567DRAFT_109539 [Paraphoma chrysanthemicola]|uniref:BTB domain-containing protein n=1 Tax=Paraphoma chrysanthemicola TaxID=798071 RepID=A0A8K0VVB9_9PLEO|nr:hypothetical protein FB567DRAFT_109539 [Paraphoma chrysanthemicola]